MLYSWVARAAFVRTSQKQGPRRRARSAPRGIEQRQGRSEFLVADLVRPPMLIEEVLDVEVPGLAGGGERGTSRPLSGLRCIRHDARGCDETDHTNPRACTSSRHPLVSYHRTLPKSVSARMAPHAAYECADAHEREWALNAHLTGILHNGRRRSLKVRAGRIFLRLRRRISGMAPSARPSTSRSMACPSSRRSSQPSLPRYHQ